MPSAAASFDETPRAARREIPYALLAVVSLLIGIGRLVDAGAPPLWLIVLDTLIALSFLLDWIRRIREAARPGRYALRNSYEIVTFIPFTLVAGLGGADVLRSARLLRLVRVARYGRFAKVGLGLARLPRRARQFQRIVHHAQLVNIGLAALVTVSVGAVALLVLEREPLAGEGYGSAFWWSLNLFTNVNYAIPEPTTPAGHLVAAGLMIAGVGLVGVFIASLANAIATTREEPPPIRRRRTWGRRARAPHP